MEAKAVITGDIINFTKLSPAKRQKVIQDMEQLLHSWVGKKANAEVFRGDSYQALFNQVTEAIKRSIQLLCWFKKHPETTAKNQLGTRISIGIGEIAYQGKSVLNSDGEAFHLSGRNFDKMKPGEFGYVQNS